MNTHILRVDSHHPDPQIIQSAAQVIQSGGLVAFPTETVYGLGANALSAEAVDRIFIAKQRPANDPVIVHIAEMAQLHEVATEIPEQAIQLAEVFFPGALTLILQKHPDIPPNVTAKQNTVAVRMPSHPVAQALIRASGVPIAAPSANRFSRPSPTTAQHVSHDLQGKIELILDAGSASIGVESTILDLSSDSPVILRPGGIPLEAIQEIIPQACFLPHYLPESVDSAPSPGTLLKHYSPNAEIMLFDGVSSHRVLDKMRQSASELATSHAVGILTSDVDQAHFGDVPATIISLGRTDEEIARNLFKGMRELDAQHVDVILVRAPQEIGIGLAIRDRLIRAANGKIIVV